MPATERFNLVLLPSTATHFQLSANSPGYLRLVSPVWTESETRAALAAAAVPPSEVEELFRGNRMVYGGRDPRYRFFSELQLRAIGLAPVVVSEPTRILSL